MTHSTQITSIQVCNRECCTVASFLRGLKQGRAGAQLCLLLLFALPLLFSGLGNGEPCVNSERRCLAIVQTMFETGNLLVPRLNDRPHLTKPPLFFWGATLVAIIQGGVDLFTIRFVAASGALATVLAIFVLGRIILPASAALWAALLLMTTFGFFDYAHVGIFDTLLAAFVSLAVLGYVLATRRDPRWWWLMGTALICGFMTKGFLAWILPLFAVIPDMWQRRQQISWWSVSGFCLVVMCGSLAWYFYLLCAVPASRDILLSVVTINFGTNRSGYEMAFHKQPFWYYAGIFPLMQAPWTLFAIPMLFTWRKWGRCPGTHNAFVMTATWLLAGLILLSFIPAKAGRYLVPLLPAWALLLGMWLSPVLGADADDTGCTERQATLVLSSIMYCSIVGAVVLGVMLWVRLGYNVWYAFCMGSLALALAVSGLAGVRTGKVTAVLYRLIAALAVLALLLYSSWLPAHRFIHDHRDSPERAEYKARTSRIKQFLGLGRSMAESLPAKPAAEAK